MGHLLTLPGTMASGPPGHRALPPVLVVAHGALFRAIRAAMGLPANIRTPNAVPMLCHPGAPWTLQPA